MSEASEKLIAATFDAFGLEEGKAILDEASRRMKLVVADGGSATLADFARLCEIVAIERQAARRVGRRRS